MGSKILSSRCFLPLVFKYSLILARDIPVPIFLMHLVVMLPIYQLTKIQACSLINKTSVSSSIRFTRHEKTQNCCRR